LGGWNDGWVGREREWAGWVHGKILECKLSPKSRAPKSRAPKSRDCNIVTQVRMLKLN